MTFKKISLNHRTIEVGDNDEINEKIMKFSAIIALLVQINTTSFYFHTIGTLFVVAYGGIILAILKLGITFICLFVPLISIFKFDVEFKKVFIAINFLIIIVFAFFLIMNGFGYEPNLMD